MNEFELRKYYREFKVGLKTGLSFSGFKDMVATDSQYAHRVKQGIIYMRSPQLKERMLCNSLNFSEV